MIDNKRIIVGALVVFTALFGPSKWVAAEVVDPKNSPYWTAGIHCPEITDSPLKYGMRDSKTSKRVSDFQLFLADYYNVPKEQVVTGKFDTQTKRLVTQLHAEMGIKQSIVNGVTRSIVNPRCGDAGIRPNISSFEASETTIKKGGRVMLTLAAENAQYCSIFNYTEALLRQDDPDWPGDELIVQFENASAPTVNLLVTPSKTSVYVAQCSLDSTYIQNDSEYTETTQAYKSVVIKVK